MLERLDRLPRAELLGFELVHERQHIAELLGLLLGLCARVEARRRNVLEGGKGGGVVVVCVSECVSECVLSVFLVCA